MKFIVLDLSNPGSQLYGYKKMDNNEDLFDSVVSVKYK